MASPRITDVDVSWVRNPFLADVAPWLRVNNESWEYLEITRIRTDDDDVTGLGETMIHYTGDVTTDEQVAFCIGRTVSEAMSADFGVGVGLRMALHDAQARSLGVPVHALFLRPLVRRWVPMAWWTTKLPPELLAAQARLAESRGYTRHKMKARPWFDAFAQAEAVQSATSAQYRLEMDWNSMLGSADVALPVLRELEEISTVGLFESPIDRRDVEGHARLRRSLQTPLIEHWDRSLAPQWLRADALDGFVFEGWDPARLFAQADLAAMFHKRGFIQLCGSGVTAAWVTQLGSVLPAATLPHITATNAFTHDLLRDPLVMRDGHARVPDGPGLGVEIDDALLAALAVPRGTVFEPTRRIIEFTSGRGTVRHYPDARRMWAAATEDASFLDDTRGASLRLHEDDGTADFDRRYAAVASGDDEISVRTEGTSS